MDEGLLSIISVGCGKIVKMLITLELHGIFRSNFSYLFILTVSSHSMQKVNKALLSIILASQCFLVKMLITLEPHHIF